MKDRNRELLDITLGMCIGTMLYDILKMIIC